MKTILLLCAAALLLSSCGNQPTQTPATPAKKVEKNAISDLVDAYLDIKDAMVTSKLETIVSVQAEFGEQLAKVDLNQFSPEEITAWTAHSEKLSVMHDRLVSANDVESKRAAFSPLSDEMVSVVKHFGNDGRELYHQFCPMAFNDQGAYWLSRQKQIANPYFGSRMMRCGSTKETL